MWPPFEEIPRLGTDRVAGQRETLDVLIDHLTSRLAPSEIATRYGIRPWSAALVMVGPPGCGKTLLGKVAAAEVAAAAGRRCYGSVVHLDGLRGRWHGEAARELRRLFEAFRKAGEDGCAVLFLHGLEDLGRAWPRISLARSDHVLCTILTELDGMADEANLVVLIEAHRTSELDPALVAKLPVVRVERPDRRAARAMLEAHLPPATRDAIIQAALARLYDDRPAGALCLLALRDGSTRGLRARELVTGRLIEQIAAVARGAALARDAVADITRAVDEVLERLVADLTPSNVHSFVPELPLDSEVASVRPTRGEGPHSKGERDG